MSQVRALYVPPPYQDAAERGRLILRDGSTATIGLARPEDEGVLLEFLRAMAHEPEGGRLFRAAPPDAALARSFCDAGDPRRALTLIVTRAVGGRPLILAAGRYVAREPETAEVSLGVLRSWRGKGLGPLLLERLSLLAVNNGFRHLLAVMRAENRVILDVFRESGFEIREAREGEDVRFDLSVLPSAESVARSETRDRLFTAASLRPFFKPNAVAVVGASRNPSSLGFRIMESLVTSRFQGPVYPVNPRAEVVLSMRAYPSVRDLPESVDLAVLAVPRDAVLDVVEDCAARGVRALVVITAGFAETGEEGRRLQGELLDRVRGHGLRLVGPNCLGLMDTDPAVRLNASFMPVFPPPGRVAMSSQSGALGVAILSFARQLHIGLSSFVSVGNKADVSGNDLLQYWETDPGTDVILLYLESFGNPRRFARLARRVSRTKPIVAVKGGRTTAGTRAAGSHTAALAASDVAVDALFRQTGVIRAETLEEMFDLAAALGSQPLPLGRRVGIVTNAGGPGILCSDTLEASGMQVPVLSARTQQELRSFLPPAASVQNPVDMIASADSEQYRRAVELLLTAGEVDGLLVIHIPVGIEMAGAVNGAIGEGVRAARAAGAGQLPVLGVLMVEEGAPAPLPAGEERIPAYLFPEAAARVMSKIADYAAWRREPPGMTPDFTDDRPREAREICRRALAARGPGWLTAEETRDVLTAFRLPVPPGGVARTGEEAAALARSVGFPVAVKLASHRLVHKTEVGGVRLGLESEEDVRRAFAEIREALAASGQAEAMDGVVVQPMLRGGVEVMVGVAEDPLFGPLIAFGLGGIHVEVLGDVTFRVTPLTDRDAAEMVREIRGRRLLEGYRGHPPADIAALQEILLRTSLLVEEITEIQELDLNPVFAFAPGAGCLIADARIRVASPAAGHPERSTMPAAEEEQP